MKKGQPMDGNSPRTIPLSGVKNFRDMGGYVSADGRTMRWGHIFRSGHLSDMTEDCGVEMLARDIETVIDFRSDAEKVRHPVHWPEGWIPDYHPIPIGGNAAAWVKELYEKLATTDFPAQELRDQFIQAFKTIPMANKEGLKLFFETLITQHKGNAMLFHCTAGKDRTGIAGALLMKALDVSEEQIMEDFLRTNDAVDLEETSSTIAEWLSTKSGQTIKPGDVLPLVGVEADFLQASYQVLREKYGSVEGYLESALGLSPTKIEKLKDLFLK
jgi:protein-tyrosine phosphatase